MSKVNYYRDSDLPILEIKSCDNAVHSSRKHAHNELSIGIVRRGTSVVECERESFIVSRGTLICIPPEVIHKCSPHNTQNWSFYMLYLKKEWVEASFDVELRKLPTFAKVLDEKDFSRINDLCSLIQRNKMTAIEKESFLLNELSYFLNMDMYLNDKSRSLQEDKLAIRQILDFLDANYLEKVTLDDLCKVSGLSKYYLVRAFEDSCKLSPHAYLTMLRINYAKSQLQKNRQIAEVALEAGFYDQSHFVKVFKQYLGTTPIKYTRGI